MDIWSGSIYDPPSLHKYLYAQADPANRIDPSGYISMIEVVTVAAIISVIISIIIPNLRGLLTKFTGNTNKFTLQFLVGGALGKILFGGAVDALIWERDPVTGTHPLGERGLFTVYMFGLGGGAGLSLIGSEIKFETKTKRRIEDFEGIGHITAVELGFGVPILGLTKIYLPDGTPILPKWSPGVGIALRATVYAVMTVWNLN